MALLYNCHYRAIASSIMSISNEASYTHVQIESCPHTHTHLLLSLYGEKKGKVASLVWSDSPWGETWPLHHKGEKLCSHWFEKNASRSNIFPSSHLIFSSVIVIFFSLLRWVKTSPTTTTTSCIYHCTPTAGARGTQSLGVADRVQLLAKQCSRYSP